MVRRRSVAVWAGLAVLVPSAFAACSDDDDDAGTTAAVTDATITARPPVIVDLTGDDETFADWEAEIADPAVVAFVPGSDDGSAQFNPGLQATAVGTTEVTLTNSASGTSVTFTVSVVKG